MTPSKDPLNYQSPGAHGRSQWITDDGPGGNWLVIALIVLTVIGVIGGGVLAVVSFLAGWW